MALQSTENLWPNAIRSRAAQSRPYAKVVNVNGEVQDVTFADLENASNRAAWFLDQNCPDTMFVYMGPSDLRYLVWSIAAMKTGKCVKHPLSLARLPSTPVVHPARPLTHAYTGRLSILGQSDPREQKTFHDGRS